MLRNIFAFALVGLLSHQTHAFSTLPALSTLSRGGFVSARMTSQKVGTTSEIPAGERKSVKVGDEDVLVVNHKNTIYALSPKCPHLGLPMKTGSKFDLKTGKAVKWSESVLGLPGTQFLGNIVGNIGGAKDSPAKVFAVSVDPDGAIVVDTARTGSSGAPVS